jgi:hypothetical protein
MTRFLYYNKAIIPKILLSKYIYLKKQDLPQITKFQVAALTHKEQASTSIYLLFLLFLHKPSFFRKP